MVTEDHESCDPSETKVKLDCGVYGEGSVFSVNIKRNQNVEALQKAIAQFVSTKENTIPARLVTLYLARKEGKWLKSDSELKPYLKRGRQEDSDYVVEMIPNWNLDEEEYFGKRFQPGEKEIHILVELPHASTATAIVNAATMTRMPSMTALMDAKLIANECISLLDWDVGIVHGIPSISKFMSSLGGCTHNGKIFWRLEDKQVVSILVDGWFRESSPDSINEHANKKSILMGSPGIGKSILCV